MYLTIDQGEFIPGPGAYQPKDRQIKGNDAPKATLKSRHFVKLENTPGYVKLKLSKSPGYYDSHIAEERMRPCHVVKINNRRREDRLKSATEITPGPSDYVFEKLESVKPAGPAYSLGKKYDDQKRKFILY